jgi:hypothetical protein
VIRLDTEGLFNLKNNIADKSRFDNLGHGSTAILIMKKAMQKSA